MATNATAQPGRLCHIVTPCFQPVPVDEEGERRRSQLTLRDPKRHDNLCEISHRVHVADDVPEIPDSSEPSGGRPFPKPRARRRRGRSTKDYALAQLRGYWEPEEVEDFEKDAATVLAKALNGLQSGLADRVAEEEVLSAWNDLVGEFVAQNSQPIRLDRKVLYVQVLQSAIHYTLERQKADLLQKLQTRFGARTIRQLRFRIG